jgi:hypothetical protein
MSYKVMAVGARMFMSGFYRSLLVDKTGFAVAARVGREKMLETKTRIGRYKCEVSLNDFIIPVLYERGSSGLVDWGKLSRPSPILDLSRKQPHCPVGRELDILLFETRILSTRTNFVWLTGQRGVGEHKKFFFPISLSFLPENQRAVLSSPTRVHVFHQIDRITD